MNKMSILICLLAALLRMQTLEASTTDDNERSIAIIVRQYFRGEEEFAERVRIAGHRLGWKVDICDITKLKKLDPNFDWALTLVPGRKVSPRKNEYLVLFDPVNHYFDSKGSLRRECHGFTGYLTTYETIEHLSQDAKTINASVYDKRWYPTVQFYPYQKVTPTRLFFFIGHWGMRYDDMRYKMLQFMLAQKEYTNFFGDPLIGKVYGKAFRGPLEYDGQTVINKIAEMGVCLILHSETHLEHGIPSGRIFEAASASAVIISDMNPFVIETFGDSVFYVDHLTSGTEMFAQIDTHMSWIQSHPEEALEMARRAHQIFEEKFLLEEQLLDFDRFHQSTRLLSR